MLIGYVRVSTGPQNLELLIDALTQAGCDKVFHDEISGVKADRPGLQEALAYLRAGDTLVVWQLDCLGRSLKDPVQKVEALQERDVDFRSLHENRDTHGIGGKFQFHVFSALAEFERDLIRERTMVEMGAAMARGRMGGRKRALTPAQIQMAARLMADCTSQIDAICTMLKISRSTLYRYVSPTSEMRAE